MNQSEVMVDKRWWGGTELRLSLAAVTLVIAGYFSPLALALMASAVVLFLASIRFRPLLLAIVFFIPVNPYLTWDLPIKDLGTLIRFALFAGVCLARQRSGEPILSWLFSGKLTRALLFYFGICLVSATVFNPLTPLAARELMRFSSYLCLYYTVVDWARTEADVKAILQSIMLSTIAVAAFGFYQAVIGDYSSLYDALYPVKEAELKNPPFSGRITSFLSHYNALAAYLMLVIPFCIGFAAWARDIFTRRLAKAVLVLASVALILTQSRGGLLAYVGVLVACAWFLAPNPKARRRYVALILVFSIAGGAVLGLMFARLAGVDAFTEASRLAVWAGSAAVFSGSPIAGIGYGNLRSVLAEKIGVSESYMLDAHNLYLELLAETGILGLVAFAILVFVCLRYAGRMRRASSTQTSFVVSVGVTAAIWSVLVHGGVDYIFHHSPQFAVMFFLLLALLRADQVQGELKTSQQQDAL